MTSQKGCSHETLVVGESCRVEQCSHGRVLITLGDLTLRVSPGVLIATAKALGLAAARLDTEEGRVTRLLC